LSEPFLNSVNSLPRTVRADNFGPFSDFFKKFGIYSTKKGQQRLQAMRWRCWESGTARLASKLAAAFRFVELGR
jgi:hypothetical protein